MAILNLALLIAGTSEGASRNNRTLSSTKMTVHAATVIRAQTARHEVQGKTSDELKLCCEVRARASDILLGMSSNLQIVPQLVRRQQIVCSWCPALVPGWG